MSVYGPIEQKVERIIEAQNVSSLTLENSEPINVSGFSQISLMISVSNYGGLSSMIADVYESTDGLIWFKSEDINSHWTKALSGSENWTWARQINSVYLKVVLTLSGAAGENIFCDLYLMSSQAGSSSGGTPPTPGTLEILDEGGLICSNVTTLNFIGTDVLSQCASPGIVNVYIPPPAFDSHWNTDDGANGAQWTSESISRLIAHISDPIAQGNPFNTSGWEDTVQQATLQGLMTFTTPSTTTGFGGDSTAHVVVYDANGTNILEELTTAPITADGSYGSGNIQVTISSYAADGPRFKAQMSVVVDVAGVLASNSLLSGRIHVVVVHITDTNTDTGTGYAFVQTDVFLDNNPNTPQINGNTSIVETPASVLSKHLSGLEYYILGSRFTVGVIDIDNLNRDTSRVDSNLNIIGINYGLPALHESMHGSGAANFSNWSNLYNDIDANYNWDAWAITQGNFRYVGDAASIDANPADTWGNGAVDSSPGAFILVDTWGIRSTDKEEYFDDEARRQDEFFNAGTFPGNWNSMNSLVLNEAMVFNSQIMHPDAATLFSSSNAVNLDWSSYQPDEGGPNPDYSPLASQGDVNYYRTLRDSTVNGGPLSGISRTSGRLIFSGNFMSDATIDLTNGNLEIFIYKVSGMGNVGPTPGNTTPLLLHGGNYNFATFDDGVTDGHCRQATSSGQIVDFTFGGFNMEDGIYIHVKINNKIIRIDSMIVTFI